MEESACNPAKQRRLSPRMRRAALVVAALFQLTAGESRHSDSLQAGTVAYIVSPNNGRWLFSTGLPSHQGKTADIFIPKKV
jgi:hypothetical protein